MRTLWLAAASVVMAGACKKAAPAKARPAPVDAAPVEGAATPLPPLTGRGAIGAGGAARVIATAPDGAWVALCADGAPRLVVGDGEGLAFDRILATSARDVVATRDGAMVHVDIVARTQRVVGRLAPVAIAADTRRIVVGDLGKVVVRDVGAAARTVAATGESTGTIASIGLATPRWAIVTRGSAPNLGGRGCDPVSDSGRTRDVIDLDPGAEAVDRVGPEIGLTATGEVTLDGQVVIVSECVAHVIAALATPPRVLARCARNRELLAGPGGVKHWVSVSLGQSDFTEPAIPPGLTLGQRVVCPGLGCVDLVTGYVTETYPNRLVWTSGRFIVTRSKTGDSLAIARLPVDGQSVTESTVTLPRVTTAVTVDAVTGRRREGTPAAAPEFIGAAGAWLLYGRHVIDLEQGVLVSTMRVDALAIDDRGRLLVTVSDGTLRWSDPRPLP